MQICTWFSGGKIPKANKAKGWFIVGRAMVARWSCDGNLARDPKTEA